MNVNKLTFDFNIGMVYQRKSWQEKLNDNKNFPKILSFNPSFPCGKALVKMGAKPGDSVVLAPPREVDAIMRCVPQGKVITLEEICGQLARKHKTQYCCTLTTGIFVMTAAHAAEEARFSGKKNITPYWRTLKMNGYLNEKFPGRQDSQKRLLEAEHVEVGKKGKKFVVQNLSRFLYKI